MLNYTCLHSKTCRQVFLIIQRNARHGADCEDVTMHKQVLWRGRYLMCTAVRRMHIYVPLPATSSESVPVLHGNILTIPSVIPVSLSQENI